MYAIIDIETTGLSPKKERITEVAIVLHDGLQIVDVFSSLVCPEKHIPANVARLTGITDEMVRHAPKFWEIAKKIVLFTEKCTFVAHNANFDYQFIRAEFASLGYDYQREKLCTIKLAKKIVPGLPSYSLGHLANFFGITNSARHRAAGDAEATAHVLGELLKINNGQVPESFLKGKAGSLGLKDVQDLPDMPGVYYLQNWNRETIYIGKSKNLKARVQSHFRNGQTKRASHMIQEVAHVEYTLTGSELVALLLESDEIKQERPKFNRAQRRNKKAIGLYKTIDTQGYYRLAISPVEKLELTPLRLFDSMKEAREMLFLLCERFALCQKLCGLYESAGACFNYHVEECKGACVGKEQPTDYNQRVAELETALFYPQPNFIARLKGRSDDEWSIVWVEKGSYQGFGYVPKIPGPPLLKAYKEAIQPYQNNEDVKRILVRYLREHPETELFSYDVNGECNHDEKA
ncbi:MAG: exonuclease domain-containing protein [Bacteroidota bacterium]